MSFYHWLHDYKLNRSKERLGQAFVNDFIKADWPELFYEKDDAVSLEMIKTWLTDICIYPNVPKRIDPKYQAVRNLFFYEECK